LLATAIADAGIEVIIAQINHIVPVHCVLMESTKVASGDRR
jgi:hypothetical protein